MSPTSISFRSKESILLIVAAFLLGTGIDILLYQSILRPLAADVRFFGVFLPLGVFVLLPVLLHFALTSRVHKLLLPKSTILSIMALCFGCTVAFFFTKESLLHGGNLVLWVVWLLLLLVLVTSKNRRSAFALGILLSGLLVSVVAVLQVLTQGSLGLHMLGESHFSLHQIGSSRLVFGDFMMQRGYGLFPHPNIAFAWISTALFALCSFGNVFSWREYPERLLLCIILSIGLLATGSKSLLILFVAATCAWIVVRILPRYKMKKPLTVTLLVLTILIPVLAVYLIFGQTDTITDRLFYLQSAWNIFLHSPMGIGLGAMPLELSLGTSSAPWMLQPVHSTFALMFVEGGFIAGLGWACLHGTLLVHTLKKRSKDTFLLLTMLLFLIGTSFVDHYWMTFPPLLLVSAYYVAVLLSKHLARRVR